MSFTARLFFFFFFFALRVRAQSVDEDLQVVLLPMEWGSDNATIPLRFSAFGKQVDLLLRRNEHLVTPNFQVWKRKRGGQSRIDEHHVKRASCHYLHENSYSSAAVSLCDAGTVQGFIFYENDSLEITPLDSDEETRAYGHSKVRSSSSRLGEPHVIKRRRVSAFRRAAHQEASADSSSDSVRVRMSPRRQESSSGDDGGTNKPAATETLTIELAVFFDETAYKIFKPHLSNDEAKLLDLLLAYVNNIQALFHHPSLGRRIELALVRLELMQSQPRELAHLDGERSEALDAFCRYANGLNPARDEDPGHWDMGLYVSGLDFYALENGTTRNPVTMGLAPVGGVCWDKYACVIAEFGVNNRFGRPFPSAGFTSVYIAAHEMAHNLGMHHDSSGNVCPKDGFIMSPSRGLKGESQWSSCSREVASALAIDKPCLLDGPGIDYLLEPHRQLDHRRRFGQVPGRYWPAKRQCELLLRDREALVDSLDDCCSALRCRSPSRAGLFLAGPALDGTKCAADSECRAGECLPFQDKWEPVATVTPSSRPSGWSSWREGSCESGCIRGSLGFLEGRRTCLGDSECSGLAADVSLCKDAKVCEGRSRKRLTAAEHASLRCLEFGRRGLAAIDAGAGGIQAAHEAEQPWIACALFCRSRDIASYYSPRAELHELGLDPYFPDGTWCHRDEHGQDFFCRRHHCLPESFRFEKERPIDEKGASTIERYLDLDGRPIAHGEIEGKWYQDGDRAWLDSKDYADIPASGGASKM